MVGIYQIGTDEEDTSTWYNIIKSLESRLDKEISSYSNAIITGQVDGFEGYKLKVGIIQGLNLAKQHIKELKNI
jgi:hypothetical protein